MNDALKHKSKGKTAGTRFKFAKELDVLLGAITSPFAVGILITGVFVFLASTFYHVRGLNESGINQSNFANMVFRAVEAFDFIVADSRFLVRGERRQLDSDVVLVGIDDESLEIVGRWPWSRDLMANMLENLIENKVKAIALDVIWSEAQENSGQATLERLRSRLPNPPTDVQQALEHELSRPQPDDILAETVKKYQDRVVLGVFPTDDTKKFSTPFSDYCRNEAFNRINGSVFVKPDNITLVVEDTADKFEPVKFNLGFERVFEDIQEQTTKAFLKREQKASVSELAPYASNRLRRAINNEVMKYCDRWLEPNGTAASGGQVDGYYDFWKQFFGDLANPDRALQMKLVPSRFEPLAGLDPESAIATFKKLTLSHPVPQYNSWTINIEKLHEAASFSGCFMADQDNDGKIRKNPLFYRTGNRIGSSFIPSMALQTYLTANPGYQAQIEIDVDPRSPDQKIIKSFRIVDLNKDENEQEVMKIPADYQGRLKINYAGPQRSYAHISAKELLNNSPEMQIEQRGREGIDPVTQKPRNLVNKAEFLKDKIVLIGATAIGIYDLRVTPFEKNFPGPETHVTVIDNLVRGNFLRVDPSEARTMLWALVFLGILISFGVAFTGPLTGFLLVGASGSGLFYLDQFLMKKGLVATMILPALLVVSIYVLMVLYKYFTEERKKRELRQTFSKYVSPAIVDEILKSSENIELGGKKQRMTVFFSDVRGFTTFSEKLDPQVLSDVLNRYLTPMTKIVFENKGTLDKYMGDALMAFFGAPIAYGDHAKYACRCALASIQKLKEIQKEFAAEGLPLIDIGIGLNTSEMSVGNMGSDIVRSYTVMGDGVNLGSRLEGINKEYGTRIIISEFTFEEIKQEFTAREVDWVRVKGKNKPVRIYELICEGQPDPKTADCVRHFCTGFDLYHAKQFQDALREFEAAVQITPDDAPSLLYVERCQELLAEPPPADWDGVYVMKTK